MAEAVLNETLLSYVHRRNMITTQITQMQNSKTLASAQTRDLADWRTNRYKAVRNECKNIFTTTYVNNPQYTYHDYTEIPEYAEEIEYVDCYYESQVEEMTSWEAILQNQITTLSTELQEINSYMDSYKTMISENIKNDYNYAEGIS